MNVEWHNHWALPENFTTPVPNPIPNPNPNPILTQSLTLILYQGGEILRERQHKVGILQTRVRKKHVGRGRILPVASALPPLVALRIIPSIRKTCHLQNQLSVCSPPQHLPWCAKHCMSLCKTLINQFSEQKRYLSANFSVTFTKTCECELSRKRHNVLFTWSIAQFTVAQCRQQTKPKQRLGAGWHPVRINGCFAAWASVSRSLRHGPTFSL